MRDETRETGHALLDTGQVDRLRRYLQLLLQANQRMNLTRITDPAAAEVHHVGDALTLLPLLPPPNPPSPPTPPMDGPRRPLRTLRLVDIGSGGGVPGLVLAIARPDVQVLLVEATKKKARFLSACATDLGLENVRVDDRRAEETGRDPTLRGSFDIATSRAVARLPWLVEWCLPLLKVGGRMLAMKGPRAAEELQEARRAIQLVGGGEPAQHPAHLPAAQGHLIIEIPKLTPTPLAYPRLPTIAKARPLVD